VSEFELDAALGGVAPKDIETNFFIGYRMLSMVLNQILHGKPYLTSTYLKKMIQN